MHNVLLAFFLLSFSGIFYPDSFFSSDSAKFVEICDFFCYILTAKSVTIQMRKEGMGYAKERGEDLYLDSSYSYNSWMAGGAGGFV